MTKNCYFVLNNIKDMNAIKFLFENFLKDKRVYVLNQNYWAHHLGKAITSDKVESENWYRNEFANGVKIYDGNPIYSLLIRPNKSIRIIQEEPESNAPEITAWIQQTEGHKRNKIEELVISLELSELTKELTLELVRKWADKDTGASNMEALIAAKLEALGKN